MGAERDFKIGFSGMPNPIKEFADLQQIAQEDGEVTKRRPLLDRALYYGSAPGPMENVPESQGRKTSKLSRMLVALGGAAIIALAFGQTTTGKSTKK